MPEAEGAVPEESAGRRGLEPELMRLYEVLLDRPAGIAEYELLGVLRGEGPLRGLDNLELFRVHFLLFHHLHRLRVFLEREGLGTLEIHCLGIRLLPPLAASANPDHLPLGPDPLAEYYLKLENLSQTTEDDVEELLQTFWRRYRVYGRKEEALAVLGLGPKATALEIRRRYRELSREHHPDAGGDPDAFCRVSEAMEVLRALGFST
ncbi:MAG: DnaJ domain-containing protein [Deltaproteobacteria bacterium]|nr:DnaJ domain-containing protein [Deltaproteobacteria bacterium]